MATALAGVLGVAALPGIAQAATTAGDRYIVTFVESATADDVAAARERAVEAGAQVHYDYDTALTGFAAYLPNAARDRLLDDDLVADVEPDEVITVFDTQNNPNTGLDRIDERKRPLDGEFRYASTGAGVTAYVIDTGIRADHAEFGGRVRGGVTLIPGSSVTEDCTDEKRGGGHGTHVAGIIGGRNYGVAKDVTLVPVRVFDCGWAPVSRVVAGVEWVTEEHRRRGGPAVANLSAGIPKKDGGSLDEAVRNAIALGITFVAAAGNNDGDACDKSPARVSAAITVGAVDEDDKRATFSNIGECIDLFAPGVRIRSAGSASPSSYAVKDGTSMAAPFVAGVAAAYLQGAPGASPSRVRSAVVDAATRGVLSGIGSGSPNRLVYSRLLDGNDKPEVRDVDVSLPGEGRTTGRSTVPIKLKWKASDRDGDEIVAYRVQRSYDGGKSWRTIELPRPDARSVTFDARPDSKLRFRVRATDGRGSKSSNVKTRTMDLDIRQQGKGSYRGRWKNDSGSKLSGRSARISGKRGASVTFRFTGRKVRWIGTTDRDHGKAKVYIDGKYKGTVDTYSSSRQACQVLFSASVKPGKHTLRIVVTGKERSKARDDKVEVDAIVVLD